ncbi:MAG: class I SAM-dependent methyltransferase [Chloroflexota bacterium]|nr:class I SAM-dependent methyltransferase [Dehalococcoidia bacterium]MDW8253442.1 class I SAM-dependent methyltransferase [Chloroflexota bacterium]
MALELAPHEPQPTPITRETIYQEMTPFERWMFGLAHTDPKRAVEVLREWVEMCPAYDGPADLSDVLPPGAPIPDFPAYWFTPVHFQPGAHTNPRIPRLVYLARTRFTFTREEQIREHLARIHAGRALRRVLDIGTGTGTTAFAFAELWPEAEVIGIDLSAPYIRFARQWAADRGVRNVQFYLQNAQRTVFPDASFDVVHFTYVLHEMPAADARAILAEMFRLIRPGGALSAMEVLYDDTEEARAARAARGAAGPEPFLPEYMALDLERAIAAAGFRNVTRHAAYEDGMVITAERPE